MVKVVLKKCDTCIFSIFNYDVDYRLQNIYCKRINQNLCRAGYKKLKFCNYYEEKNK